MFARVRSRVVFAVWCLATTVAASNDARAAAKPLLIVSAEAAGEVLLIDPVKAQVVDRIKVGARPRGLALARDRRSLYVALAGPPKSAAPAGTGAGLAVVDITARKLTKLIAMPPAPYAVALLPDGKTAYVSNSETNEILVVDVAGGSIKKKIPVGAEPLVVAVSPDGKVVYATTRAANELAEIDTKTMTLLGRVDAGMRPQAIAFAPRGDLIFVPSESVPSITIVDAKRHASKEFFVIEGLPKTVPPAALQSAVLSRDGKRLYVTTGSGRSVVIVDAEKKASIASIDVAGALPRSIAVSADGKKLYTANGASNDIAIIDVASKKVEARVAIPGGAPWGVVSLP
jgi:YVTN family beta-propeller protein